MPAALEVDALELIQPLLGDLKGESNRPFDRDATVPEIGGFEDLAALGLLEVGMEPGDLRDVLVREVTALVAEALAHGRVHVGCIDELDLAPALGFLVVAKDPDVGGDAGVVEEVGG